MSETSDFIRKSFGDGDDIRDEGLTTPENVLRSDNLQYGPDKLWQLLDVYRPKDARGTLPVILSVHGGGWVYGDKERYQHYCLSLAQRGFAVVNFTYRLAPEFQFPAALEDTNLVASWISGHSAEYGFDTGSVFAVGDSAGAHYLSLYAAFLTNPEYASRYTFSAPQGFRLKAIALDCGKYSFEEMDEQTALLMQDLLPGKGNPGEIDTLTTLNHITPDYPPVLYFTAPGDFLKDEAPKLGAKLMECEVPHVFRFYTSKEETLLHVFNLNMRSKDGAECNDFQCAFFRSFL